MTVSPRFGVFALDSTNGVVLEDLRVRLGAEIASAPRPLRPGERVARVAKRAMELEVVLTIAGVDPAELRTRKGAMLAALGDGEEIPFRHEDDREVLVRFRSGDEEIWRAQNGRIERIRLPLYAAVPFWRSITAATFHRDVTATGTAAFSITGVLGDAQVFPDLRITTPAAAGFTGDLVLQNTTLGEELRLSKVTIPQGKTLLVGGDAATVTDEAGALAAGTFKAEVVDGRIWPLAPGTNSITTIVASAVTPDLDLDWTWKAQWRQR